MTKEIQQQLLLLEEEHQIRILYAVESGSRAWGFASADSDWDVRFIYIHQLEWYLQIDDKKDNYEKILPNDIDLSGWELKKTLRLFKKSNPPLLEWLRSPIVYRDDQQTARRLRELTSYYFAPKSCMHHYLHMAQGNFEAYLKKEQVRLKKYFYVLRPLLACAWIHRNNGMAPMEFRTLLEAEITDGPLRTEIENLLQRKMSGEELSEGPQIPVIQQYLEEKIQFYTDLLRQWPKSDAPDTSRLNDLFLTTLEECWQHEPTTTKNIS